MMHRHTPKRILVLGSGPLAQTLVPQLAALPGVTSVRQQSQFMVGQTLPTADLCVELLEGLTVAYEATLQAFAQGMSVVTGSPILAATHGPLLQRAARGQGAYWAVAAHGLANLPATLHAMQASRAVWLPASAAQQVVARMVARQETPEMATRQLQLRGADLTDLHGKQTQLQAHALLGAWQGVWAEPARQPRLGPDGLHPSMLPVLNALGLRVAYGAVVGATGIQTGPLALPSQVALPGTEEHTLLATTPHGELRVALPAGGARAVAVLAAAQAYLAGQRHEAMGPLPAQAAGPMAQLVLASQPVAGLTPLAQHAAHGWWGGVVSLTGPQEWPVGAVVLPVPAAYRPPASQVLRLVG